MTGLFRLRRQGGLRGRHFVGAHFIQFLGLFCEDVLNDVFAALFADGVYSTAMV